MLRLVRFALSFGVPGVMAMAAAFVLAGSTAGAQATQDGDNPTTPVKSSPIKLTPILKKEPVPVRLLPVFKKAETPTPFPTMTAPPTPAATKRPTDKPLPAIPPPTTRQEPTAPATTASEAATTPALATATPPTPKPQTRLSAGQLMMQGKELLERGEVVAARERFLRLAHRYPDAPETPEALYHAANSLPEPDAALDELDALAEKYPDAPILPQVRVRQAEFAFVLERYSDAMRHYNMVLESNPDAELARLAESRMVSCLAQTGSTEAFVAAGQRLIEKYPEMAHSTDLLGPLADAKLAAGEVAEAEALFTRLEEATEGAAQAMLGRGICAELAGDTAGASEIYEALGRLHPQSPEATLAAYRLVDLAKPLLP